MNGLRRTWPFSLTVPSLLMDSKSQMPIVILRIKALLEQKFLTAKEPRTHGLSVTIDAADFTSPRELVRESREVWFQGPAGFDFFSHLTSIC